MFAVIKTGGKQYRVAANDVIKIEKIDGAAGDIIEFGEVLAHGEGDDATFGAPFVSGATVTAEVVLQGRGKTVIAFKKRRRQNSRRKRGNRQYETTVRIDEILIGGAKPSKKAVARADAKTEDAPAKAASESQAAAKPASAKAESSAKPAALFSAPAGAADDLVVIKGIGPVAAGQLKDQGITTFAQLAAFTDNDIARIDANMPFSAEQIRDWQEQARDLAKKA